MATVTTSSDRLTAELLERLDRTAAAGTTKILAASRWALR
jgi:hypothetical protein